MDEAFLDTKKLSTKFVREYEHSYVLDLCFLRKGLFIKYVEKHENYLLKTSDNILDRVIFTIWPSSIFSWCMYFLSICCIFKCSCFTKVFLLLNQMLNMYCMKFIDIQIFFKHKPFIVTINEI